MLLLGIDLGTSSVKVSVIDAHTRNLITAAQYPETEAPIISAFPGWAEQSPEQWWHDVQKAILKAHASLRYNPKDIGAIGIAYQMHGLVALDAVGKQVRNSIIWCDSRAVAYGEQAFEKIGKHESLKRLLNAPGNFTASKLAWVKANEPEVYEQIDKIMLPGDFIAYKLTGEISTTTSALSEGIFWNFENHTIASEVLDAFDIDAALIPEVKTVFGHHGTISKSIAAVLHLSDTVKVTYKAGDQPNNALSLNVFNPGEVAATAGTSGVIYGVTDQLVSDHQNRINSFAHVNHTEGDPRIGVLLCINGCGILNKVIRTLTGAGFTYAEMNNKAVQIAEASNGLMIFPFGNGAERMLGNKNPGASIAGWDFNTHHTAHFFRATQEGIAYAFRYGLDIMKANGMYPTVIRAGRANMFLSDLFVQTLVNVLEVPVELYHADGAAGAAMGAGIGIGLWNEQEAMQKLEKISTIIPENESRYHVHYNQWKATLNKILEA